MSQRPGAYVTKAYAADGGVSPNAFVPLITTDCRVFWPPRATREEVLQALEDTKNKLESDVNAWYDVYETGVWPRNEAKAT